MSTPDLREREILPLASASESAQREKFLELFLRSPIPVNEQMVNLSLFMRRQVLSRIFFMHEMYQHIVNVPGIVVEFGVRWGRDLALFSAFRGMYEPYNHSRKIVGFDTFAGFPSTSDKDGKHESVHAGTFDVTVDYDSYLDAVLAYHESESPLNHIKKYELVKGDVMQTLPQYLRDHPETIIALAYFDLDLYEPTRECLRLIQPHLTKGSVLGFDELNFAPFPGETLALKEVLGLDRYALRRSPLNPLPAYLIIE